MYRPNHEGIVPAAPLHAIISSFLWCQVVFPGLTHQLLLTPDGDIKMSGHPYVVEVDLSVACYSILPE